jgi:hypothetical protein
LGRFRCHAGRVGAAAGSGGTAADGGVVAMGCDAWRRGTPGAG